MTLTWPVAQSLAELDNQWRVVATLDTSRQPAVWQPELGNRDWAALRHVLMPSNRATTIQARVSEHGLVLLAALVPARARR